MTFDDVLPFVVATAIGLLLGFERERHHAAGGRQTAGSRTMALLGLTGAVCAALGSAVLATGLAVVGVLVAVGYRSTSVDDPGMTTETAEIGAFLLGALANERSSLAAGLAIGVAVLLSSKQRLHTFARDVVTDEEMEDALRLLVMAFIVLPLLPDRQLGPYGVLDPRRVWQLVVALTAISWVGYIATRLLGARRGLAVAGLAGGFVSASATTASMGRLSRTLGSADGPIGGARFASLATYAELVAIVAVADRAVLGEIWGPCVAGAAVLFAADLWRWVRARRAGAVEDGSSSLAAERPFALRPVLLLAGVLTGALLLARWAADELGSGGAALAAAAAGLADAHAASLAVVTLHAQGEVSLGTCLLSVGAAIGTNTLTKIVLAYTSGGRRYGRRFVLGVVPSFVVSAGWLVVRGLGL